MSDESHKKKPVSTEPVLAGLIAEFEDSEAVIRAAERVRDAGYKKWDVYSPFPLHGIDEVMRRPTILPWFCAIGAVVGLSIALGLQWFTNGYDYPITVSGKKFFAIPSSMPINFELTVLITAFTAFFSIILTSGLPRLYNPLLRNRRFREGVTNNKICIAIEANDPKFSRSKTADLLRGLSPISVEEVMVPNEPTSLPLPFLMAGIVVLILALIPPILIVRKRNTLTTNPRIHFVLDMDFQPKFKTQTLDPFFGNLLEMRPDIPGTIARGDLHSDVQFYEGLDPSRVTAAISNVAFQEPEPAAEKPAEEKKPEEAAKPAEEQPKEAGAAEPAAPVDNTPYTSEFPPEILKQLEEDPKGLMARGQQRFNIYCAVCHGLEGYGDGLVSRRAASLEQPTWVKPLSIHDEPVQQQPVGKLFRTITYGIRKMPAYGPQVNPEDRWAIVLYIKALQRAKNASAGDVPDSQLEKLQASN